MFDETIRTARNLEETHEIKISTGVISDAEGYIDRQCPHQPCDFTFKVLKDDWESDLVSDEKVFCPSCGHSADAQQWYTNEQVEFQQRQALAYVAGKVGAALRRDADNWNRKQSAKSLISLKLHVQGTWKQVEIPATVSDAMRLQIACSECGCRYAVIGAAYFCPGCGHNSADHMFDQSLKGIRLTLDALKLFSGAVSDADAKHVVTQAVVEAGLQNIVTAFQRYAESLYSRHPIASNVRRNAFQNLGEGGALWRQAFGKDFASHLTNDELKLLGRVFQQRHLLAHQQGIVDEAYVAKSGDGTYRIGQRLIVKEDAVRQAVSIVEKLAKGLEQDVA